MVAERVPQVLRPPSARVFYSFSPISGRTEETIIIGLAIFFLNLNSKQTLGDGCTAWTMSVIDGGGGGYAEDDRQRRRGDRLQSATADERGWQCRSENVAERTDMTETGTRTADDVVVVTAAVEHATSAQLQVPSVPVGQLINESAAGTLNVASAVSFQVRQKLPFEMNYK